MDASISGHIARLEDLQNRKINWSGLKEKRAYNFQIMHDKDKKCKYR